jgi:signal transduction histidine kinase
VLEEFSWAKLGRDQAANALVRDAAKGGLWLGFRDGGVAYFQEGQLRASYSAADGLGEGMVRGFYFDKNTTLWVATEGGLSRIKDGHIITLTTQNGLPCNTVHWMMEDDAQSVWTYLSCGLMRVNQSELDAWASHAKETIQGTVFDSSDGVASHQFIGGYSPLVAKSAGGKLWFVGLGGFSVIDPQHLPINKVPPPVYVEQIIADGKTYDATQSLRLPPNIKDLAIDYTALSLVAPEKVQVRVKLEGQDNDWRVPVNPRHAHYTNLGPGTYRFRVIASNNSGVWNKEGAVLEFSIAPAFYQTAWFAVACGVLFLALLWLVYQFRVRQLAVQFNRTFEARVSERTRIARELHDTLLQSFQGLLLRFQSVLNVLPERPTEAKQRLQSAIDQAAAAITEGRDAVQGLRSSALETNELADGIRAIAEELTSHASAIDSPVIEVEVEGTTRALKPIVRDEAYRIAGEALRNAFRHAKAERITVEIRYDKRQFRLRIRDDGKGIDEDIMQRQPSGHFGLPGMRERAETVGAHLEVWTRRDSGTQVDLSIPGKIAYVESIRQS